MANVWVGTDYYIPSIDSSGTTYSIEVTSTTTSNTYTCLFDKDSILANVASVGAVTNIWFEDSFYTHSLDWCYPEKTGDNTRVVATTPTTNSVNGTDLIVDIAIDDQGGLRDVDPASDTGIKPWILKNPGIGYQYQDGITFTNINAGTFANGVASVLSWTGTIAITDKDLDVSLPTNSTDAQVAANTLPYINVLISTNTWTP